MSDEKNDSSTAGAGFSRDIQADVPATSRPMTALDAALAVMRADMKSHQATKRSLGVMYAMVMAGNSCAERGFWEPINTSIRAYGGGEAKGFGYLEGVKKVAWSIFDEVAKTEA